MRGSYDAAAVDVEIDDPRVTAAQNLKRGISTSRKGCVFFFNRRVFGSQGTSEEQQSLCWQGRVAAVSRYTEDAQTSTAAP